MCKGGALDILDGSKLFGQPLALFDGDWSLSLLCELVDDLGIVTEIYLGANDEAGDARTVVVDLGEPFLFHVLKRGRGSDTKADEKDVGLGIREGSKSVIILLACPSEDMLSERGTSPQLDPKRRETDPQCRTSQEYKGRLQS